MEQRTEEWFSARAGKVTASRVADLMARTKSGYSASRENYMAQLVVERFTGGQGESFTKAAMQWGTEQEPFARAAYEAREGVFVDEVGFVPHPTIEGAGASPDGLVGDDGLVEIKCPNTATMIDTLINETVPGKYYTQMQMQMACTGRKWCDYVVFDPRMPVNAQLFVKRVERDETYIADMEGEITKFLDEVDAKFKTLQSKLGA
ncbi:MAG TPA: YqaJ viral recombinase family protein [Pseudomonadales bacterium]|nr:YqaJ viral recombinase family protein [Pseudomonadales bacterium]